MREQRFNDVLVSQALADMMAAASDLTLAELSPAQKASRKMMQENPKAWTELKASLDKDHWLRVMDHHKRLDEEEARQRAEAAQLGTQAPETSTTDLGAEKVLEKLRELKERAES